MADAVQSRIEREARFASDVSHELRSPITALSAAVEVLDGRRDDLPERSQKALDVVVSQVQRFDQMVLDLLEISRVDAGRIEMHLEPTLLGDFLRTCRGPVRLLLRARRGRPSAGATIPCPSTSAAWSGPSPTCSRTPRSTPAAPCASASKGGAERVRIRRRGRRARACPASEKDRIFERFARGSAARHRVGTGLGLALVAEHARLHGGRAWVEDRPGGGSRFVIELPAGRG